MGKPPKNSLKTHLNWDKTKFITKTWSSWSFSDHISCYIWYMLTLWIGYWNFFNPRAAARFLSHFCSFRNLCLYLDGSHLPYSIYIYQCIYVCVSWSIWLICLGFGGEWVLALSLNAKCYDKRESTRGAVWRCRHTLAMRAITLYLLMSCAPVTHDLWPTPTQSCEKIYQTVRANTLRGKTPHIHSHP